MIIGINLAVRIRADLASCALLAGCLAAHMRTVIAIGHPATLAFCSRFAVFSSTAGMTERRDFFRFGFDAGAGSLPFSGVYAVRLFDSLPFAIGVDVLRACRVFAGTKADKRDNNSC